MLINEDRSDILLIDTDGEIIYDNLGNYRPFKLGMTSARGLNIRDLFPDLSDDYPLLAAAEGKSAENFTCRVTTKRGITLTKSGSAYTLYDGDEIVGAVEFSSYYYAKSNLSEIQQHSNHTSYRKNNTVYILDDIVTQDKTMIHIKEQISQIALSDSNVLIYGETGTGKELAAQAIHNASRRYHKKFLSQNCSAIPSNLLESLLFGTTKGSFTGAKDQPGLFETAEGGTVFLDEINSLEPYLQVKLLKVIEDKKVRRIGSEKEIHLDFRIIAATNEEPAELLASSRIKPDLFYRLAVVYLELPPLSERKGDIPLLVNFFINYFNSKTNSHIQPPDDEIMSLFNAYSWPGNVRELRNIVEGAFIFAENDKIEKENIPEYILEQPDSPACAVRGKSSLKSETDYLEKSIIREILNDEGSLTDAAKVLGISKQLLNYKLKK